MGVTLLYKGTKYTSIKISLHPDTDMRTILKTMDAVCFPDCGISENNIRYAILELINNSLRAHRDNREKRRIVVSFHANNDHLSVTIKDFGGGFDIQKLPFDINESPVNIDPNSDALMVYRKDNNFLRFGLGFYIVKKTFENFQICFHGKNGISTAWKPGKAIGTLIILRTGDRLYEG